MQLAIQEPYMLMVQPDDFFISPRKLDENFGTMICFHRRTQQRYIAVQCTEGQIACLWRGWEESVCRTILQAARGWHTRGTSSKSEDLR